MQMPTKLKFIIGLQGFHVTASLLAQAWLPLAISSVAFIALVRGGNGARKVFYALASLGAGGYLVTTVIALLTAAWGLAALGGMLAAFAIWQVAVFGSHEVETWYRFGRHGQVRPAHL